jgi:hypothetical protein
VFFTVLAYDTASLIVEPGYRLFWRATNTCAGWLPTGAGGLLRSLAAPLMVVGSVATWMALPIIGFALIYLPGVTSGGFALHGIGHSFWTALYLSGATISSLAFSGAQPAHTGYFFLGAAETLIGVSILSLAIAYVLGLYGVVQDAAIAWVTMQNHAGRADNAESLLAPHFHASSTDGLSVLWRDLHGNLAVYLEGMRRYPVAYYFHTRQRNRSLPAMLRLIADAASAVRWGLPSDHPAARDPWLPGLLEAYQQAEHQITDRFLTNPPGPVSQAARRAVLANGIETQTVSTEPSVAAFLAVRAMMVKLTSPDTSTPAQLFERYSAWWDFTGPGHAFVAAVAEDFGTTPFPTHPHPATAENDAPRTPRALEP